MSNGLWTDQDNDPIVPDCFAMLPGDIVKRRRYEAGQRGLSNSSDEDRTLLKQATVGSKPVDIDYCQMNLR